jgi:hypothetical protein
MTSGWSVIHQLTTAEFLHADFGPALGGFT